MLQINSDGKEIEFSGLPADMQLLAQFIEKTQTSAKMTLPIGFSQYYPITIQNLTLIIHQNPTHKLVFQIIENRLTIMAGKDYLRHLSESLTNFFDETVSLLDHFHLYYDDEDPNNLLENDNHSLIFIYE